MKKRNLFFVVLICIVLLIGCGKNDEENTQSLNMVEIELSSETEEILGEFQEETTKKDSEEECSNLFAEFKNLNFSFLSGAGGWSTELTIAEDGTFSGVYSDGSADWY